MKTRSLKTIRRDNQIHEEYQALMLRGGEFAAAVSRKFIYDVIARRTGYSTRTIAEVLNHTKFEKIVDFD